MKKVMIIMVLLSTILVGCSFDIDNYQYEDEIWELIGQYFETVEEMKFWIYYNISYMSDKENQGELNYCQSPYETVKSGYGDCEDFAALYMYLLYLMTGEKSTLVIGISIEHPENNHAMVNDSVHDYLYSPQVPLYRMYVSDYDYTYEYSFNFVMRIWTNYGNKTIK